MSNHNARQSINNNKLVSSILSILEEENLVPVFRRYAGIPLDTMILFLYDSKYKDHNNEAAFNEVKRESLLRIKRRWVKNAIKNMDDPSAPLKELRAKRVFLEDYIKQFGIKAFQHEFKVKSLDIYMNNAKKDLLEWAESGVMPIYTYPFFEEKTSRQHKMAIQTDLLIIIGNFLVNNTSFLKPTVYQSPNFVVSTSFFGLSNRAKLEVDKKNVQGNEDEGSEDNATYHPTFPQNQFGVNPNANILVSTDFVNDLNKKVPDLDAKDFELFLDVLNYRDVNFQATRRIQFPLKRLVNQIYNGDSGEYYKMTTERLLKLANYRLTETNDDGEYFVKGLFSSVKILNDPKDKSGGKIVTAYVSEDVYDDYLRQQVVNIYSDKVEELKGSFAYHLVFVLQKERFFAHQMNEPNPVSRKWLDFRYSIRFNRRTKKENLEEFEKAVAQIKEQQFLIEDYYRNGEYYYFTFFPLSSLELEDFSPQDKL